MSFVNHISYTRAVSARIQRTQSEIPIFKGSSFNRKPKKEPQSATSTDGKTTDELHAEPENILPGNDLFDEPEITCDLESLTPVRKKSDLRIFSSRSRNKCKEKIFAMFGCSGADRFTFLTLSFIAPVSDKDGAKCLNKFLTVLRKRYGNFMYVWVAEKQDNGNIHFHVIQNRRFPIKTINALWVLQQYNAGLSHDVLPYEKLTALYYSNDFGHISNFLNPVDIKKVQTEQGLAAYLTNYVTKNNQYFHCAVWHCNRAVSALFTSSQLSFEGFEETSSTVNNRVTTKQGKTYVNKTFVVLSKNNGSTLAMVNNIYNQVYYKKFHHELDELNKIVVDLVEKKIRIERHFLYESTADYLQKIYNLN